MEFSPEPEPAWASPGTEPAWASVVEPSPLLTQHYVSDLSNVIVVVALSKTSEMGAN